MSVAVSCTHLIINEPRSRLALSAAAAGSSCYSCICRPTGRSVGRPAGSVCELEISRLN